MSGELLGSATLELDTDQAPLDSGLDKAEARVAAKVAAMQSIADSLHLDIKVNLDTSEAEAKLAALQGGSAAVGSGGGATAPNINRSGGGTGLWGVRGPEQAGSRQNPVVMVMEAAKYTPLGTMAAAVGETDQADETRTSGSALSDASNYNALRGQLDRIAQSMSPTARLAAEGQNGLGVPQMPAAAAATSNSTGDVASIAALQQAADALSKINGRLTAAEQRAVAAPVPSETRTSTSNNRTIIYDYAGSGTNAYGGSGAASRSGGGPATAAGGSAGGSGGGGQGGPPFAFDAGSGGGGGGNRRVDIYHHSSGEGGGGGGGSRFQWNPFSGSRSNADSDAASAFSFANLFKGDGGRGGAFGLPGFGSIGSLAGLGLEHWILSGLGVGASATAGVAGAGLLGTAGLTQMLVGSGSNALVNKATESQIQATTQDYYALQSAVAEYGKGSKQAVEAQNLLNYSIAQMGGGPAQAAEMQVYANVKALKAMFDTESNGARAMSADVMDQVVKLATSYTPLVVAAAQKNLGIINSGLKPLFAWLQGPEGKGIFETLENAFSRDLPVSIHAFDMGLEDFLRLMAVASQYTGGLARSLDNLFTEKNGESTVQYEAEVHKLVGDFDEWKSLLEVLGEDLDLIFKQDAGTANSIVGSLTDMLVKLHAWEESTTGQTDLQNIFYVHKQEILALLKLLPDLMNGYGSFYLKVAPPLVSALTNIAGAVADIASAVEKLPGGADLLGLLIVMRKLSILGPGLKLAAGALGLFAKSEDAVGAASGAAAAGETAAGGAAAAGGAGGVVGMLGGLGAAGASDVGAGLTAAGIAAAAAAALPIVLGSAAAIGAVDVVFGHLLNDTTTATWSQGHISGLPHAPTVQQGATSGGGRFGGINAPAPASGLGALSGGTLNIKKVGDFANDSAAELRGLISTLKDVNNVNLKVNGLGETKTEVLGLADAALKAKLSWDSNFSEAWKAVDTFTRDSGRSLGDLKDDFASNFRLIEQTVGTGSAAGQHLMAENVSKMVFDVTNGMLAGQISVKSGMAAINSALKQGLQTGAISWTQDWTSMFSTVTALYNQHKIDTKQYQADLRSIMSQGDQRIKSDTESTYQGIVQTLKTQLNAGEITHQQFVSKVHQADVQMGSQAKSDMADFAAQVVGGFATVTAGGARGLQDLIASVNSALKLLGQKQLTGLQVSVMSSNYGQTTGTGASNLNKSAAAGGGQLHAGGGLVQIGKPGQAGRDTVPLTVNGVATATVAPGEKLAVINRHQSPLLDYAVANTFGVSGLDGFFAKNKTPNFMASGGMVPGFAGGGTLSYSQLEGLWDQAGGPSNMAALMAAIALAESGGDPTIVNSIGASGLWQIHPGEPGDLNPLTNARDAVAKYTSQGLDAWTTYTSGAYKQFLNGSVPASAGAAIAQILAPHVKGGGTLGSMTQAALDEVTKATNQYLASKAPAGGAGAAGGTPNFPVSKGPVPAAVQVALEAAKSLLGRPYLDDGSPGGYGFGAAGLDCSGFVSTVLNAAGLVPGHQLSGYYETYGDPGPGKYITTGALGPYSGPLGHVMMEIDGTYFESGGPTGQGPHIDQGWSSPFTYYRHPHGYGAGGTVGSPQHQLTLAELARIAAGQPTTNAQKMFLASAATKPKKKAAAPKKPKALTGTATLTMGSGSTLGADGPLPFFTGDLSPINEMLSVILGIDGGSGSSPSSGAAGGGAFGLGVGNSSNANTLGNLMQWYTNLWGSGLNPPPTLPGGSDIFPGWNSPGDFVISADALGNTISPYLSPNLDTVVGQLSQMLGWQGGIVGDLGSALTGSQNLVKPLQAAIKRRVDQVAAIRKRVLANVAKIKALRAKKTAENKKNPPYAKPKTSAQRAANTSFDNARKTKIAGWNKEIASLQAENQQLAGNEDSVGSGGELHAISNQLGTSAGTGALGTVEGSNNNSSGLYSVLDQVQGWETLLGGTGGAISGQQLQYQLYQQGLAGLAPGASTALAAAVASAATASATSQNTNPLTGTVGFAFQGQNYAATLLAPLVQAVGAALPPFGGTFHQGGVVPGPVGAERMILAQGGEVVSPLGGRAGAGANESIDRLVSALGDHQKSVAALTQATCANTSAISSTGGHNGARYSYGRASAYDPSSSSDDLTLLGVGS